MKKIFAIFLLFLSLILGAKEIKTEALQSFSNSFKQKLSENSYTGLFCYVSPKQRRIFACEDFNKTINLGDSSNIITNYLASQLEKEGKFKRNADIHSYAKIFKYNGKNISFADLISSTALISRHLDKIYPKDALEYEYFDFLWQLNPELLSGAKYEFSRISNLGAIYALSYSQTKKSENLIESFKALIEKYLAKDFPSIAFIKSENNLETSFSLSLKDFTEYLAKEVDFFTAKPLSPKKSKFENAWLFSEMGNTRLAMVAGQSKDTFLIANFYDLDIAIAIYLDDVNDEKARNFVASILQDFKMLLP